MSFRHLCWTFVTSVAAAAAVLSVVLVTPDAQAATTAPIIFVAPTSTNVGGQVSVHGMGFAPNEFASIAICGDGGLEGAQGCDLANQATLITDNGGRFSVQLRVAAPPAPCPCVIEVDSSSTSLHSPLAIAGAPNAPLKSPQQALGPRLRVSKSGLDGYGTFLSWLGWPAKRTLHLTIENTGSAPAPSPVLSLEMKGWGRGTTTLSTPRLQSIPAGGKRSYVIPVDLGPVASGGYTVTGKVYEGGGVTRFSAATVAVPWGLLLLVLVGLQALLILVRNRVRARIVRSAEPEILWVLDEVGPTLTAEPAVVDITDRAVQELLLREPETDEAMPASSLSDSRVAVFIPALRLTCSIERVKCPEVGLEKITVLVFDDFAYAPWEALHEDVRWSVLDPETANSEGKLPERIQVEGKGFVVDISLVRTRPPQILDGCGIVQPVHAEGQLSLGEDRLSVDCYTAVVSTALESPEHDDRLPDANRRCSWSYAFTADGRGFFLMSEEKSGSSAELDGWIIRDGRSARIVEGRRMVEDRIGPYPQVVTVELRDSLGRMIEGRGHARNGIGSRRGAEGLVLHSLVEWDFVGVVAVGEDADCIGVQGWRSWRKTRSQLRLPGLDDSGVGLLG